MIREQEVRNPAEGAEKKRRGACEMTSEQSEVSGMRRRIEQEEEAARLGFCGPAMVARHEWINARAERAAARILWLIEQGRHTEAYALLDQPAWGENEAESECFCLEQATDLCGKKGGDIHEHVAQAPGGQRPS
jgi:hypothetical protein